MSEAGRAPARGAARRSSGRPDPVDQLDLEIAYAIGISVQQIRGEHRVFGAAQPADRHVDANVVILAPHPAHHLLSLKRAIPPRTGHRVPGLAHAFDVEADVVLGHHESATDPRSQQPIEPGFGITDQPRTDHRQHYRDLIPEPPDVAEHREVRLKNGAAVFMPKKPVTFSGWRSIMMNATGPPQSWAASLTVATPR